MRQGIRIVIYIKVMNKISMYMFLFSIIQCVFDMYDSKAKRQLSLDEVCILILMMHINIIIHRQKKL